GTAALSGGSRARPFPAYRPETRPAAIRAPIGHAAGRPPARHGRDPAARASGGKYSVPALRTRSPPRREGYAGVSYRRPPEMQAKAQVVPQTPHGIPGF